MSASKPALRLVRVSNSRLASRIAPGAYQLVKRHPEHLGRAAHKSTLGQGLFKPGLFTAPEEVLRGGVVKEVFRLGLLQEGKNGLRVVGQTGLGFEMPDAFERLSGKRKPAFGGDAFLLSGHKVLNF